MIRGDKQDTNGVYGVGPILSYALGGRTATLRRAGASFEHNMEGRKGEKSHDVAVYDLEQRRLIDAEITRRAIDCMKRSVASGKPFYAYVPFYSRSLPDAAQSKVQWQNRLRRFSRLPR